MPDSFEIKDQFYLNSEPFKIISGALHYFRVVPGYWRDRLEKLRAMGCNTVETYVPWNLHQPKHGGFCTDGMLDLARFLRTAQDVGLYAIVRPTPYICGEWEFGGLPAWLLTVENMRLRSSEGPFLGFVREYYEKLFPVLTPLQVSNGGPIILMQVENEYGAFGNDTAYLEALRDMMLELGTTVPLITSDGPWDDYLKRGIVAGAHPTANFGSKAKHQFKVLREHTSGPLMCTEFWVGWFDDWGGGAHHTASAVDNAADLDEILRQGSVNFYMFHGGTNFGFMNGSNYYDRLTPDVTSYDYDAPLSEDGSLTPKYEAFKEVIERHTHIPACEFSTRIQRKAYGVLTQNGIAPMFSALNQLSAPIGGIFPKSMEMLGQSFGYILYHTELDPQIPVKKVRLLEANDRAQFFVDGQPVLTLYDHELLQEHPVNWRGGTLDILVENMGRVNYGPMMQYQRKGINGSVLLNGRAHSGWQQYPLPLETSALRKLSFSNAMPNGTPAVYRFSFNVDKTADTFLSMEGWGKGCVFLNGFNLGRFWEVGPQKRLYIPAPLLYPGENELLVFETEGKAPTTIELCAEPDLGR